MSILFPIENTLKCVFCCCCRYKRVNVGCPCVLVVADTAVTVIVAAYTRIVSIMLLLSWSLPMPLQLTLGRQGHPSCPIFRIQPACVSTTYRCKRAHPTTHTDNDDRHANLLVYRWTPISVNVALLLSLQRFDRQTAAQRVLLLFPCYDSSTRGVKATAGVARVESM